MRNLGIEWNSGQHIEVGRDQDALPGCPIAAVELQLMRLVVWQPPVKVDVQARQIEQRRDVRLGLTVVVAEQTFVVTNQAGVHIRSDELIVLRETLRGGELKRPVVTTCATETTNARSPAGDSVGQAFAGIKQEVGLTIIERAVFNY